MMKIPNTPQVVVVVVVVVVAAAAAAVVVNVDLYKASTW